MGHFGCCAVLSMHASCCSCAILLRPLHAGCQALCGNEGQSLPDALQGLEALVVR